MYENLFNLIDDLQKLTIKIKVQEVLNEMVKDERVREILDADVVMEYYEKMYKHFEEHPKDFLFPNREWLKESLKRLKVNSSNVFDEDANIDHVKREEVIVLFMLLWINMQIQDQSTASCVPTPTELADNFLEEKHRSRNIARNTKFVVREMTGMSNKDYKAFLKKFKEKEVMRYDETSQCFEDILKISSLEFDHEVILEAVDVYNRNVYHLNKALLKLKEKLNEEKD